MRKVHRILYSSKVAVKKTKMIYWENKKLIKKLDPVSNKCLFIKMKKYKLLNK
jgi:hypothetical protein